MSAISPMQMSAMKKIVYLVLFFVVCLYLSRAVESLDDGCSVGDIQNLSNTINSYPANTTYLNTGSPSTCAGVVYNVTYCYLVPVSSGGGINQAMFAFWAPTGNNTYKQVTESLSEINFSNDGCDDQSFAILAQWSNPDPNQAQAINCRSRCFDPPLAVSQGSVFGLTLLTNDTNKRISIAETNTSSSSSGNEVCIASQLQDSNGEYTCDNGSAVFDNTTLLLHATVYYCNPLTAPIDGSINTTITFDSTVVSFTCNDQFIISPPLVLKCVGTEWRLNDDLSSVWNNSIPSCVPEYCPHPDDLVEHAAIISMNETQYSNGTIVTFKCNTGYFFYYSSTIDYQCIHGAWQTTTNYSREISISCYPYRCPLPANVPNGYLLLTSSDVTFPVNSTVRFACNNGYMLSFTYPLLCLSNGTWNSSSPQCYTIPAVSVTPTSSNRQQAASIVAGYVAIGLFFVVVVIVTFAVVLYCAVKRKRRLGNKSKNIAAANKYAEDSIANDNEVKTINISTSELKDLSSNDSSGNGNMKRGKNGLSETLLNCLIPPDNLKLLEKIGQGEFGIVYRGVLNDSTKGSPVPVAIKTPRGFYSESQIDKLIKEAEKMQMFNDLHVLTLTGICVGLLESPCIVMPFMSNGSLLSYLRKEAANLTVPVTIEESLRRDTSRELLSMCLQVAKGMEYLSRHRFVHCDLAARNCMISADRVIKVADFGLTEDVYTTEYFKLSKDSEESVKLPLKWMALESIHYGKFSEKSDVWSYGVLCWEVFSCGKTPYPGMSPKQVVNMLDSGERLDKPLNASCHDEVYSLMLSCWNSSSDERPNFNDLVDRVTSLLLPLADYMDLRLESLTISMPNRSDGTLKYLLLN